MCKCGCNTCETKGPLLTEGKVKSLLSEGLQYHIDKKIPLFETVYRIGSDKHLALIKEARKMYSRNVIDLCEDDEALIKTHLGEFGLYEGVSVPLDLPMLEESKMPTQDQVDKFFTLTQNEKHYLNSKPVAGQEKTFNKMEVEPWDEYDLSNFNSLVRKAKDKGKINEIKQEAKSRPEYIVTKDDHRKSKFPFDKLRNNEFKIVIAGEGEDQDYMIFWKDGDTEYWEWEAGDMKRQLRSALMAIAKRKLPIMRKMNEDDRKHALLRVEPRNYEAMIDKLQDMNINHRRESDNVIKVYIDNIPDKVIYNLTHDVYVDKFVLKESLKENEDKLLKIKQELDALRPGTISWIDDIFISSYDGSLQVELDYTLYPDEIKQLAQIATKYGMELKYMTGKNATLVKNKINEDRKYNQEELLRLDLIAHRRFGCDYEKCTDEQKAEVLKDKVKVGIKEALQEAKKKKKKEKKDPPLNKPKRGGSKAYYVYVRDPKTKKIKKVSFGSGGLRAKIRNPKARKAFAARHNCKNKKDRTKAGYWSCNLPRYAPALGLGAKMNTFW